MKTKKIILIAVAVAVVVGGGIWFFTGSPAKHKVTYASATVSKGDISNSVTATGTIEPVIEVEVGTQVSGIIDKIYVDYNSKVKKDQLLAQIDPALFEATVGQRRAALNVSKAEVQVAENEVDYAKKNLARIKKLNASRYSADKELDLAEKEYNNSVAQLALKKAQVEQAQAALDSAETELRYTKIISPVEGIVVSKEVEVGQTVAASFQTPTLFNVAEDLTKMQIEASVVEADIAKVHNGQTVEFSVDSFPDEVFYGKVTQVRNEAINTSNVVTYEVIIEVDNKDLKLKPGMTANVEIITAEKKDILLAPNKALRFYITDENGETKRYKDKGIWVLEKGVPQRIVIKTGVSDDDYTEVSGEELEEGMKVIIDEAAGPGNSRTMRMRMPR